MTIISDIARLQETLREVSDQVEANKSMLERHEEQISGTRGLSAAINSVADEVKSLRKAAYWVAGLIVTSSIGFAFSVLTVFSP
jgi:hypothetical protein